MGGEKLHLLLCVNRRYGSPPRGRGKGGVIRYTNFTHRITPAWAGKSIPVNEIDGMKKDHPRVGGEKVTHNTDRKSRSGSPPRGRGKGIQRVVLFITRRITPAWAGKSLGFRWCCYVCWDHPRVGGEKFLGPLDVLPHGGSPPRGRGKEVDTLRFACCHGITPAWAGKRYAQGGASTPGGDHPRVGGEKPRQQGNQRTGVGSPPRGRGKVEDMRKAGLNPRITPAWAGKS